jgi:hypothetical protein
MTELLFLETTIRGLPVSFAIDLELALKFGISGEIYRAGTWSKVYDLQVHFACFVLTFTVYPRGGR